MLNNTEKHLSIYVHFPFCMRKCTYCDFASYAGLEHLIPTYMDALRKEMELASPAMKGRKIFTVYFGGGTPSYPDPLWIEIIMHRLFELFDCTECKECTLEANPGTIDVNNIKIYKTAGFNRLSIGLQSVNDHELIKAGRIHRFKDFTETFHHARETGFDNISADLIFGFPWQTFSDWKNSVDTLVKLNPEHISCYDLKLEEGTPLYEQVRKGRYSEISDVLDREMYYYACNVFAQMGYKQYEISNFAKPGYESKHNIVYWKTGDYIGFGAGAHSYVNNVRYGNTDSVPEYVRRIAEEGNAVYQTDPIGFTDRLNEFAMLGFRLINGIDLQEFHRRFGVDFLNLYGEKLSGLFEKKLVERAGETIRLTRKGLDFANIVFMEFI